MLRPLFELYVIFFLFLGTPVCKLRGLAAAPLQACQQSRQPWRVGDEVELLSGGHPALVVMNHIRLGGGFGLPVARRVLPTQWHTMPGAIRGRPHIRSQGRPEAVPMWCTAWQQGSTE